jgi:hypothetical protein
MSKKKPEHYVNNKELLEAMVVYRLKVEKSYELVFGKDLKEQPRKERGKRWEGKPAIPNCVQYIHNFDPDKSKNPFAYFTQVIHYAFLRRIQKEKKQLDIKTKIIEKTGYDEVMMVDDSLLSGNSSEYNSIKDAIQHRNNNR